MVERWEGAARPGAAVAMSVVVVVVDMSAVTVGGSAVPNFPAALDKDDPDAAWCGLGKVDDELESVSAALQGSRA